MQLPSTHERLSWGGLLLAFAALALLVRIHWAPLWSFDLGAVAGLHGFALMHPLFVLAMKAASRVGSAPFYWALAAALVGWLFHRERAAAVRPALFAVLAIGGGPLLNTGMKALVHRARPVLADPVAHAGGLSFPSGHAQAAMVGYGVLVLLVGAALRPRARRWLVGAAAAAVLTIGFSRVALGVHYPSDVLGGYLLGAAWLGALLLIFGRRPKPLTPQETDAV